MKLNLSKEKVGNLIWILAIVLILFTPVGFHARVLVGKIFSFDAKVITEEKREVLSDYNWMLTNAQGDTTDFLSSKGKVVVINFWATWCPPCVAEMPSFQNLYNDYGHHVEFYFVAKDEKTKVQSFMEKKEYTFPIYYEGSGTPDFLKSETIPATFILSKSGKIVVNERGVADWDSKSTRNLLDSLLKE